VSHDPNFINPAGPVYADRSKTLTLANDAIIPFTKNMFTTPVFENLNQ